MRRRPRIHANSLQEPPIAVLSLFKELVGARGESAPSAKPTIDASDKLYIPPLEIAPRNARPIVFYFCTKIFDNPQDNAAENFADPGSVRSGNARCARRAPPLPRESATASSSGRAALIAARGNRDLQRANREAETSEQGTSREFDATKKGSPLCLFASRRAGDPWRSSNCGKANEKRAEAATADLRKRTSAPASSSRAST